MAAMEEGRLPSTHDLADVLFCYPVMDALSEELEFDDLINLHLTSKTLYRALHLADFDVNHVKKATKKPRKRKAKKSSKDKGKTDSSGGAGGAGDDVDEDSYFQMLLNRAGRLECEIPPPDEAYGGRGAYSRPCSRKVKRCVKCRKGACRHARSFIGTQGNVRKACLDCLNYGTNPWLRIEDRQASLESITHRKVDFDGVTIEIVTLKDSRLEHREDLAQDVVTGSCHCLDTTDNGSLKRWICSDCEMTERYEVMQYANWERTHQGLCECGCEVFQGILREGAMEPEDLEVLPEQDQEQELEQQAIEESLMMMAAGQAQTQAQAQTVEEENNEAQEQKVNNNNQPSPGRRRRRRRKLIGMPRKKSRTAAAIRNSGTDGSGSVASRVSAIEAALNLTGTEDNVEADATDNNNGTGSSSSDPATASAEAQQPQPPAARPAALGLCAWCGLRVYGLHELETNRPATERLIRPGITGYDTASEAEPDDENENENENEQNDNGEDEETQENDDDN